MIPAITMLFFFGLMAGLIWFAYRQQQLANANLAALAERLGLEVVVEKQFLGSDRHAIGTQLGREIRFWAFTTGSGKSTRRWVAAGVRPRGSFALTFDLRAQGWGTKFMELFGTHEITVGDPVFDDAWFVQTNQPEFLAAALVPGIRAKLMAQPKGARAVSVKLASGLVQYVEEGTFSKAEIGLRLESQLPLLHDLADVAEVSAGR